MTDTPKKPVGPEPPSIYFCMDGRRVAFVPIFLLKSLFDRYIATHGPEVSDWFHFTGPTIPQDRETQERFLQYLLKTFKWEAIRNLVQPCGTEPELLSRLWRGEVTPGPSRFEFDILRPPEKLYRYCRYDKQRMEELLVNDLLHLANPGTFNDPFDCNFNPDVRLNMDQAGICCFAARYDSVLMFSHYARGHTGLCLVFDPYQFGDLQTESGDPIKGDLRPVFYYSELPQLDLAKEIALIATAKSGVWAYEREYRLFAKVKSGRLAGPGKYRIQPATLTGVIFGCEMSMEQMREIRMFTRNRDNFQYVRAIRKPDHFGLSFNDVAYLV